MSIPGVESARRRRVSHGRCSSSSHSSSLLHFSSSATPYRIIKLLASTTTTTATVGATAAAVTSTGQSSSSDIDEQEERGSNGHLRGRALAARNRLDEKLRSGQSLIPRQRISSGDAPAAEERAIAHRPAPSLVPWKPGAPSASRPKSKEPKHVEKLISPPPPASPSPSTSPSPSPSTASSPASSTSSSSRCDQQDCPVCLDAFDGGLQPVVCLPCHHKFHSACLAPWLRDHVFCPFCRAHIPKQSRPPCRISVHPSSLPPLVRTT